LEFFGKVKFVQPVEISLRTFHREFLSSGENPFCSPSSRNEIFWIVKVKKNFISNFGEVKLHRKLQHRGGKWKEFHVEIFVLKHKPWTGTTWFEKLKKTVKVNFQLGMWNKISKKLCLTREFLSPFLFFLTQIFELWKKTTWMNNYFQV